MTASENDSPATARVTRKTFEEFWGELLLVRFHEDSEHFARYNAQRVDMVLNALAGIASPRILDLGCGSGDLDFCLAERGAQVTGVDRIGPVLDMARGKIGQRSVNFITADLGALSLPASAFDAALLFGLVGLRSREEDATLFAHCRDWLAPGGILLVDAPLEPDKELHEWTREFDDGLLTFHSEYDAATRLIHFTPLFHTQAGETIELYDPYDATRAGNPVGIWRYHYSPSELTELLTQSGFSVSEGEHCSASDHYLLIGKAAS